MMTVKRLEWKADWGGSCDDIPEWRASTPWGSVTVSMAGHRDDDGKPYTRHSDVPNGLRINLISEAEAKYEAKVLSALTNTSGDDEAPVATEDGHIWHERVFSSMKIKCCMNCGFIKNEKQPNKPCPGPIGVEPREEDARPQSAAVRDGDLIDIIKRMIDNPATMVTDFHDERATVKITFDTHDGAWSFMHAAGDARRALHSTQEG